MDLQTLSTLDDLLSDVLLDGVSLWFQTHKMNKDYRPLRLNQDKILEIIQRRVIVERKVTEAIKDLLDIEFFKKLFQTEKEIQDFTTHARRYLSIYLPTAGFEISHTDRYSSVTNKSEACVIANRPFEVGNELRYCAGTIANLNEQEEKDLENRTSDFSVIKTSRKGTCLFLGPARFVNHDCDPNCSFMSAGANVIYFKVLKPINVNDEITTHYGDNYFGTNNQECLCATCEKLGRGGYKVKIDDEQEEPLSPSLTPVAEEGPPSRRLRNRGKQVNYYPTLFSRSAKKGTRTRSRATTHPVESDTIPSVAGPLTPISQKDTDSNDDPEQAGDSFTPYSSATPISMPEGEGESLDDLDSSLVSSMMLLRITDTNEMNPRDQQYDSPSVLVNSEQNVISDVEEHTPSYSTKNFRMSIDFLCHSSVRTTVPRSSSNSSSVDHGAIITQSGRTMQQNQNQDPVSTDIRPLSDDKAVTEAEIVSESAECNTCKSKIHKHEISVSKDCRRCHRHFLIYGVKWPSRNSQAIVAKIRKAEREEAMKLKAAQAALEAENLKKKKLAAEAARMTAKAEAKTKQEQLKAEARAAAAFEKERVRQEGISRPGQTKPPRKKNPKPKKTQLSSSLPSCLSVEQYQNYGPDMPPPFPVLGLFENNTGQSIPMQYIFSSTNSNCSTVPPIPSRLEDNETYSVPVALNSENNVGRHLSSIITDGHPFHHSPYVVFVDPQDGDETRFWWIAVTVPRSQLDATMPELVARKDGTLDPDLVVVRFLEDYKYSICNISGLRLFHPDQEPYRGYISTFGREFVKNLGVKRALAFLNGDVPAGLPWRHMTCDNQLSLAEVAMFIKGIEARIEERNFWHRKHLVHYNQGQGVQPSIQKNTSYDLGLQHKHLQPLQPSRPMPPHLNIQLPGEEVQAAYYLSHSQQQLIREDQGQSQLRHQPIYQSTGIENQEQFQPSGSHIPPISTQYHPNFSPEMISQSSGLTTSTDSPSSASALNIPPLEPVKRKGVRGLGKKTLAKLAAEKKLQESAKVALNSAIQAALDTATNENTVDLPTNNRALESATKPKQNRNCNHAKGDALVKAQAGQEVIGQVSSTPASDVSVLKKDARSTVVWWPPVAYTTRQIRSAKRFDLPRLEKELQSTEAERRSIPSHRIIVQLLPVRFPSLPNILEPLTPRAFSKRPMSNQRGLQLMKNIRKAKSVLEEGDSSCATIITTDVSAPCNNKGSISKTITVCPKKNNNPSKYATALGKHKSDNEYDTDEYVNIIDTDSSRSESSLSSPPSSDLSEVSSLLPSSASSPIDERDKDTECIIADIEVSLIGSAPKSSEQLSLAGDRKVSHKRKRLPSDAIHEGMLTETISAHQFKRIKVSSSSDNQNMDTLLFESSVQEAVETAVANSGEDPVLPSTSQSTELLKSKAGRRPLARMELDRLREWTIKGSILDDDKGSSRTRSGLARSQSPPIPIRTRNLNESISSPTSIKLAQCQESRAHHKLTQSLNQNRNRNRKSRDRKGHLQLQQPPSTTSKPKIAKKVRTELERLQEWSIFNSLLDEGSMHNDSVSTRSRARLDKKRLSPEIDIEGSEVDVDGFSQDFKRSRSVESLSAIESTVPPTELSTLPTTSGYIEPKERDPNTISPVLEAEVSVHQKPPDHGCVKSEDAESASNVDELTVSASQATALIQTTGPVPTEMSASDTLSHQLSPLQGAASKVTSSLQSYLSQELKKNKQVESLLQWSIKDSIIPIEPDMDVRSARSRTKAIQKSDTEGATASLEPIVNSGRESSRMTNSNNSTGLLKNPEPLSQGKVKNKYKNMGNSKNRSKDENDEGLNGCERKDTDLVEELKQLQESSVAARRKKPASVRLEERLFDSEDLLARVGRRRKPAKLPNRVPPKFKVGDEVDAPAENDEMFDAEIIAMREHKTLQDVYEYKVHYHGYLSRYDIWLKEELLAPK